MEAKAAIDRVGIGCEPASAASLAGTRKLVAAGEVAPDAMVVGILTGHVLKDADAVVSYHLGDVDGAPRPAANRPVTIPAELSALERIIHGDGATI
jgi:threonine synthase